MLEQLFELYEEAYELCVVQCKVSEICTCKSCCKKTVNDVPVLLIMAAVWNINY